MSIVAPVQDMRVLCGLLQSTSRYSYQCRLKWIKEKGIRNNNVMTCIYSYDIRWWWGWVQVYLDLKLSLYSIIPHHTTRCYANKCSNHPMQPSPSTSNRNSSVLQHRCCLSVLYCSTRIYLTCFKCCGTQQIKSLPAIHTQKGDKGMNVNAVRRAR